MKGIRTTIAIALASAAALVSLTGCAGNAPNDFQGKPLPEVSSLIYVSTETGKVTKFVDLITDADGEMTEEVLFEEGYSKKDTEFDYAIGANPYPDFSDSVDIPTTVMVEGKPYPIATTVSWQWRPMNLLDQIALFNERVANPDGPPAPLEMYTMPALIRDSIHENIVKAVSDGALPGAQYATTGYSLTGADTRVLSALKAGKPAWEALQDIQGTPVTSERYVYSFLCAVYDVTMSNGQELRDATATLPDAAYVDFSLDSDKSKILIETTEPCSIEAQEDVIAADNPKDYSEAPPPPPGG